MDEINSKIYSFSIQWFWNRWVDSPTLHCNTDRQTATHIAVGCCSDPLSDIKRGLSVFVGMYACVRVCVSSCPASNIIHLKRKKKSWLWLPEDCAAWGGCEMLNEVQQFSVCNSHWKWTITRQIKDRMFWFNVFFHAYFWLARKRKGQLEEWCLVSSRDLSSSRIRHTFLQNTKPHRSERWYHPLKNKQNSVTQPLLRHLTLHQNI